MHQILGDRDHVLDMWPEVQTSGHIVRCGGVCGLCCSVAAVSYVLLLLQDLMQEKAVGSD